MSRNVQTTFKQILLLFAFTVINVNSYRSPSDIARAQKSRLTEMVQYFPTPTNDTTPQFQLTFLALLPNPNDVEAKIDCTIPKVMPVLEKGIAHIQHLGFVHNVKFNVTLILRDTFCSSIFGPIGFFESYTLHKINAVFGLPCEYVLAPISRYAGVWQIPVISSAGNAGEFDKKSESYPTLTRVKGADVKVSGSAIRTIAKDYNWTRTAMIYQNNDRNSKGNSVCFFCLSAIHDTLKNVSIWQEGFDTASWNKEYIVKMLKAMSAVARIVTMCADPEAIRQIMLTAEELNMIDSGEYVFINVELFLRNPSVISKPWFDANDTQENNERARRAYTAMLTIMPRQPTDPEHERLSNEIKTLSYKYNNYTFKPTDTVSTYVTSFFDGVLLYAHALNDSIREDPTVLHRPLNGSDISRRMWNRSFKGITGNVTIDSNGDRIADFSLLDMNPMNGQFEIVAYFKHNRFEYVPGKKIHWAGNRSEPPPDRPICGYDGTLCPALPGYAILSIVLGIMVIVLLVGFFFGYRYYKAEAEINSMSWKVSIDDVMCSNLGGRGSLHSLSKYNSQNTLMSDDSMGGDRQIFIPVGVYRGCKVAIKAINERNVNLNRSLMLELKRMKDLQHDHLVKFYGACLNPRKCFMLTEYCPKGSLQDILENEQFQLDWMFRLSLIHDIVRGMQFLHSSDIKSHGNLKSSNCVVDSRFVLKITDFGLHSLRKAKYEELDVENCNSHSYWSNLLWTAPELLKMENNRPPEGTQKGDVYSFGIIVHEVTTREGPFYLGKMEKVKAPQEIIELVKGYPTLTRQPFRPLPNAGHKNADINSLMTKCWAEDPVERPDFNTLKTTIRKFNKDNETGNIVDNLLKRMELYANNLEELVEERTQDYIEEKKKCEKLLYQLLPQSVAAQLISGEPVIAETFDQVTIYFSDIVGFTAISAESTPMQVVQFLNDLYTCFDSIVENFDVYKVETIGDAYMVVSGLPIRNENQHAREIARLALALLDAVHNFKIRHRPNDRLKLRIGLHTGACVAGVVGLKMPRYCLFGDTVNTASRMESNGEALKIHISEDTKLALDEFGTFVTTLRGFVPMKGKGEMLTYWLEGEMAKPDSLHSPHKMFLPRRASLRHQHNPPRHSLHHQNSEVSSFAPPPYQLQIPNGNAASSSRLSNQTSPNLRAKRKISSSSPKLNGASLSIGGGNVGVSGDGCGDGDVISTNAADYKTEDFNYLDLLKPNHARHAMKARDSFVSTTGTADIYSSRSLRESNKDSCELANFRLPLSGTLKSHYQNNNRTNHNPILQSNSHSNLSGILHSTSSKLRLKTSPTISTLATSGGENISINSGSRIRFNVNYNDAQNDDIIPINSKMIKDDCDDHDEQRSLLDKPQMLQSRIEFPQDSTNLGNQNLIQTVNENDSYIDLAANSDAGDLHESLPTKLNVDNSGITEDNAEDRQLLLAHRQPMPVIDESNSRLSPPTSDGSSNAIKFNKTSNTPNHNNTNYSSSSINQDNSLVKANNVINLKFLCKSPSNSLLGADDADIENTGCDVTNNSVTKTAVTQPLLAKINS